jgi:transcriptional regulator with XRE-family HTH domain
MHPLTVSEQLRAAILAAPVSRYRIAQETGVTEAALSRFVRGQRLLDLSSVDKLAQYLGLELVAVKRKRQAKGR